ncbi:Transposase IS4 [Popillia japonica]|uniref:Transposase IS4 n=1 Tax=Popillia japonica TaxID=7064 RepID=A0AAW1KSE5_POPJA
MEAIHRKKPSSLYTIAKMTFHCRQSNAQIGQRGVNRKKCDPIYDHQTLRDRAQKNFEAVKENKQRQGSYDRRFDKDNKVTVVKWKDNKCVLLATNYDTIQPLSEVQRSIRSSGEQSAVPQPRVVANYSKYMGGLDHHDWLLKKHGIAIRGKKWYWCLFIRIIDMAIVNGFALYNMIKGKNSMSIKDFRREIANSYLKLGVAMRTRIGRPSSAPSSRASVPVDVSTAIVQENRELTAPNTM